MDQEIAKKRGLGILGGWLKAVATGLLGLTSGAVIMYLSPLVDRVIKPAKPVANFGIQVDGQNVTFVNQSEGTEGWWDFGDGSPLQPFVPDQKQFTHQYDRPGGYNAKLVIRNLIGEENERQVALHLDGAQPKPPTIDVFDIQPLEPDRLAPATFKLTSKISNADMCIWACGSDHPMDVISDPPTSQERYVTFVKPGQYTVRLAVVQGKQTVERDQIIKVEPPPFAAALAVVSVQYQAQWSKATTKDHTFKVTFPEKSTAAVFPFTSEIPVDPGSRFTGGKFTASAAPYIQNPKLTIDPSGAKALLTGEFLPARWNAKSGPPSWIVPVQLTQEHTGQLITKETDAVTRRLPDKVGCVTIPLPALDANWKVQQRQINLTLYDGNRPVWQKAGLPKNASIELYGHAFFITATEVGGQLKIDLVSDTSGRPAWPAPPPVPPGVGTKPLTLPGTK